MGLAVGFGRHSLLALLLVAACTVGQARASDFAEINLGVAARYKSRVYVGSDFTFLPLPYMEAEYKDFSFRNGQLSWRFLSTGTTPFLKGRLVSEYGFDGYDPGDSSGELQYMEERDGTLYAGLAVSTGISIFELELLLLQDILGVHDGQRGQLELEAGIPLSERHFLELAGGVEYMGEGFTDYYFGVESDETTASRPRYEPDAAFNTFLRTTFSWAVTESWGFEASYRYNRYSSEITDSPIVDVDDSHEVRAGFTYNFYPRLFGGEDETSAIREDSPVRPLGSAKRNQPLVVILPDVGMGSGDFAPLSQRLDEKGIATLVLNPLGRDIYLTIDGAAQLVKLLKEMDISNGREVALYSQGMAGTLAYRAALEAPEAVDSLVIGCTAVNRFYSLPPRVFMRFGQERYGGIAVALGAPEADPKELTRLLEKMALKNHPNRPQPGTIEVPSLFIGFEDDVLFPVSEMEEVATFFEVSKVVELEGEKENGRYCSMRPEYLEIVVERLAETLAE